MKQPKRGIYVVHFSDNPPNVYKIGSTSDYNKRIKAFKNSHCDNIELVKFYDFCDYQLTAEHLLHYRLKDKRLSWDKEFFQIDDFDIVDNIINEIKPIIEEGLYPTEKSSDDKIRLFVIKILGGTHDDDEDNHLRLNMGCCNKNPEENIEIMNYNNDIQKILEKWGILKKVAKFTFSCWKGDMMVHFNMKPSYSYIWDDESLKYEENCICRGEFWFYCPDASELDEYELYSYDNHLSFGGSGYGTISIIHFIIKHIMFSKYLLY